MSKKDVEKGLYSEYLAKDKLKDLRELNDRLLEIKAREHKTKEFLNQ